MCMSVQTEQEHHTCARGQAHIHIYHIHRGKGVRGRRKGEKEREGGKEKRQNISTLPVYIHPMYLNHQSSPVVSKTT